MGVICDEQEREKKRENEIIELSEETKEELKSELLRIEIELKSVKEEINNINEKLQETNLTENDKEELEIELENKIDSEEDLKNEKLRIQSNLNMLVEEEKNAKTGKILRKVDRLTKDFGDGTAGLNNNNRIISEHKKQKEKRKALEREGKNIIRGPESKYERRKKLEKYFAKANS